MLRALGCSLLIIAVGAVGFAPGGDKKDGDKPGRIPKAAISGAVKAVDVKGMEFTLIVGGKDRKFAVDENTKFIGPKGGDRGKGAAGLKDDTMTKGYQVAVMASKDGKTAMQVHLPVRKGEEKDAPKDAAKDKDKS